MVKIDYRKVNKNGLKAIHLGVVFGIFLEITLLFFVFFSQLVPTVFGGVGGNVTVVTSLTVGETFPEILNITVDNYSAAVTLIANSTQTVVCEVLIRDFNNDSTFDTVNAEFFNSTYGAADDLNDHYTNTSCEINTSFGSWNGVTDDNFTALATCDFSVQYFANPSQWNCTAFVNDTSGLNDTGSDNITINELLALGVPDTINYGTINATFVSNQNITNVTNFGNVEIDIGLHGYGYTANDGLAMNCTLGSTKNISIEYEKYNVTTSNPGALSLSDFEINYTNLTNTAVENQFDLNFRQNDAFNEATNETYWRIYVPTGVAGTCQGNIVFGAIRS